MAPTGLALGFGHGVHLSRLVDTIVAAYAVDLKGGMTARLRRTCARRAPGDALAEARPVPGVVVANQASAPVAQEGPCVFTGAGLAEVIDHRARDFKRSRGVGPQIGSVRLSHRELLQQLEERAGARQDLRDAS